VPPPAAGVGPVNPALEVGRAVPPEESHTDAMWCWCWQWYEHQNMRDERVEAFTSYLAGGTYEYTDIARELEQHAGEEEHHVGIAPRGDQPEPAVEAPSDMDVHHPVLAHEHAFDEALDQKAALDRGVDPPEWRGVRTPALIARLGDDAARQVDHPQIGVPAARLAREHQVPAVWRPGPAFLEIGARQAPPARTLHPQPPQSDRAPTRPGNVTRQFAPGASVAPPLSVRDALSAPRGDFARVVLPPMSFAHEQDKVRNRWPAAQAFIRDHGLNERFGPEEDR